MLPSVDHYRRFLFRNGSHPILSASKLPSVYEKDTQLLVKDAEEAELYRWINQNTSINQLFVDTTLKLPIYAQRRLLIGLEKPDKKIEAGYGIPMVTVALRNGYDMNEYNFRTQIVRNLYGFEQTLDKCKVQEFLARNDVMIIARKESSVPEFKMEGLDELFKSSNGKYLIYSIQ